MSFNTKTGDLGARLGSDYQVHVLMWLYQRAASTDDALQRYSNFRLTTELAAAGKFDDAVLSWSEAVDDPTTAGTGRSWLFVQVKHKVSGKLNKMHLFPAEEKEKDKGPFSVYKYLVSFLDIERNEKLAGQKQYVIFTNCDVDDTILSWFESDENKVEDVMKIPDSEARLLRMKFGEPYCDQLMEYCNREFNQLVDAFKAVLIEGRSDVNIDLFRKYRGAIACKILVVDKKLVKFTPRFLNKKNLDHSEQTLRKAIFKDNSPPEELMGYMTSNQQLMVELTRKDKSHNSLPPPIGREDLQLFFERLIFAVNQPSDKKLQKIITAELMSRHGFAIPDLDSRICCATLWFTKLEKMVQDCLGSTTAAFLERTQLLQEMQTATSSFANSKLDVRTEIFKGRMQNLRVEFKDLQLPLQQAPLAIIASTQLGLLTSIKLSQMLKNISYRYFSFQDLKIFSIRKMLLDVLKERSSTLYLLLQDDGSEFGFAEELFSVMPSGNTLRLILLTHKRDRAANFFKEVVHTIFEDTADNLSLLTAQSQHMLERRLVNFQGYEYPLLELPGYSHCRSIFRNEVLEKLILGEQLTIGPELPEMETNHYISRVMNCSNTDELTLWMNLTSLKPKPNSHLTSYNEMQFLEDVPILFNQNKIIVLSSTPGMGKSTLWTKLARLAKQQNRSKWIIHIKLQDYSNHLSSSTNMESLDHAVEFLCSAVSFQSDLDKSLFKYCLQSNVSQKIYIFLDGFDELPHEHTDQAVSLLKILCNRARIFVNTRDHHQKDLEEALGVMAFSLKPMDKNDLRGLFASFSPTGPLANFVDQMIEKIESKSMQLASKFFGTPLVVKMLIEIYTPFMEKYQVTGDIGHLRAVNLDSLDILYLFNRFVYSSFHRQNVEKLKLDPNDHYTQQLLDQANHFYKGFEKLHCFLGLKSLVKRCVKLVVSNEDLLEELHQQSLKLQSPIIVKYVNSLPYFIHTSYAELFAAQYLFEHLRLMTDDQVEEKFVKDRSSKRASKKGVPKDLCDLFFQLLRDYPTVRKFFFLIIRRHSTKYLGRIEQMFYSMRWHLFLWACEENFDTIVERLVKEDPNIVTHTTKVNNGALHIAASQDADLMCALLIKNNADVNAINLYKQTPLHKAVLAGSLKVVKLLLKHGAHKDPIDQNSLSPLHLAAQAGHTEIVRSLLESGCRVDLANQRKWNALHLASFNNHTQIVRLLTAGGRVPLKVGEATRWLTFLGCLVSQGLTETVSALLEYEAVTGSDWKPTLLWAIKNDHSYVVKAMHDAGVNIFKACDKSGRSTYSLALGHRSFSVAQILLLLHRNPANIEKNCLHLAAKAGAYECVTIILSKNRANINVVDDKGMTPLDLALKYCHLMVVEILLEASALINDLALHTVIKAKRIYTPECVNFLLKYGAKMNTIDSSGNTPLHLAIEQQQFNQSRLLLVNGASATAKNKDGRCALHLAVTYNMIELIWMLLKHPFSIEPGVVKQLINDKDKKGHTALHLACAKGYLSIVQELLEAGSDVNSQDNKKQTPLHSAAAGGHWKLVPILIKQQVNLNAVDNQGMTHLDLAAAAGRSEYVRSYLSHEPVVGDEIERAKAFNLLNKMKNVKVVKKKK